MIKIEMRIITTVTTKILTVIITIIHLSQTVKYTLTITITITNSNNHHNSKVIRNRSMTEACTALLTTQSVFSEGQKPRAIPC